MKLRACLLSILSASLILACSTDADERPTAAPDPRSTGTGVDDLDALDDLDDLAVAEGAVEALLRDRHRNRGEGGGEGLAVDDAIVTRLRAGGPAGLDGLIARYRQVVPAPAQDPARDQAWRALIDAVAGQRDAVYGGLFWEQDLATAQARAAAEGKPILSLRLLGELSSSHSCANSRLFRTVLYADPELAAWLEEHFILHWSSERPVPQLAIDFGDGRVLRRTITGNSAHFVLAADGSVVDVLPGLWSPQAFHEALDRSLALHAELAPIREGGQARQLLAARHEAHFEAAAARLGDEMARIRRRPDPEALRAWLRTAPGDGSRVPAITAVPMAIGKSKIEAPILGAAAGQLGGGQPVEIEIVSPGPADDLERLMIGQRLAQLDGLHANTLAIIAGERPLDALVGADQRPAALADLVANLLGSIRQDTAKNALELHPRIHEELARRAREGEPLDFAAVDRWLYASLFQTPADDPWLGLVDPTIYTGLPGGGLD